MVFPIGDDKLQGKHFPIFSYGFIALNFLVFFYQLTVPPEGQEQFFQEYAAVPALLTQGAGYTGLMTSMFLHGGWMHLIGNMLFLRVFGDNIEYRMGHMKFLLFYIAGRLAATIVHTMTNR